MDEELLHAPFERHGLDARRMPVDCEFVLFRGITDILPASEASATVPRVADGDAGATVRRYWLAVIPPSR